MSNEVPTASSEQIYNVHIFREMRLFYPEIEASSHEEAARLAADKRCDEADIIDECDGETLAALVDVQDDMTYSASKVIDFPSTLIRNNANNLLKALETLIEKSDDLQAAIEGATDQFETEVAALSQATTAAEAAVKKARGQS